MLPYRLEAVRISFHWTTEAMKYNVPAPHIAASLILPAILMILKENRAKNHSLGKIRNSVLLLLMANTRIIVILIDNFYTGWILMRCWVHLGTGSILPSSLGSSDPEAKSNK